MDFLSQHAKRTYIPPLTVTAQTTMETVILKLAATKTHRVWIVDDYDRPKGVISLTDVMKLLDLRIHVDLEDKAGVTV